MTVRIAARIAALARCGEVRLSEAVKNLVPGSGLVIEPRGEHPFKRIPGRRPLSDAHDP